LLEVNKLSPNKVNVGWLVLSAYFLFELLLEVNKLSPNKLNVGWLVLSAYFFFELLLEVNKLSPNKVICLLGAPLKKLPVELGV